ncbi:Superoxide dismutase [Cu-Zn] [Armadillidium vulgare]|nr:Superoxide dismutase [Cu-Zn] [Armadillidium vulgare]
MAENDGLPLQEVALPSPLITHIDEIGLLGGTIYALRWNQLALVVIATITAVTLATPTRKLVFFHHNSIPSNLYKSRAPKTAKAVLNSKTVYGLVTLRQDRPPTGPTFIAGVVKGLTPGEHGIKIYEYGDIEADCLAVGNVYNPYNVEPSSMPAKREIGELGIITADETGTAKFGISDSIVSLVGPRSVIGRAIVITSSSGKNESETVIERRGCGVIGYAR